MEGKEKVDLESKYSTVQYSKVQYLLTLVAYCATVL